jgi:hypothetical protein
VAERSKARVYVQSLAGIASSNPVGRIGVCRDCCVLSGRDLCDGPIPRPEESYRLCCVILCDLVTSRMRRPWLALGCCAYEGRCNGELRSFHKEELYELCFLSNIFGRSNKRGVGWVKVVTSSVAGCCIL